MEMATIMTEKMTMKDKHDKVITKIINNAMSLRHGCPMILVFVLS